MDNYSYNDSEKNHIRIWLPVMKELERLGHDPVQLLFNTKIEDLTMKQIEDSYIAISSCKDKYPEWYGVVSDFVDKRMAQLNSRRDSNDRI